MGELLEGQALRVPGIHDLLQCQGPRGIRPSEKKKGPGPRAARFESDSSLAAGHAASRSNADR